MLYLYPIILWGVCHKKTFSLYIAYVTLARKHLVVFSISLYACTCEIAWLLYFSCIVKQRTAAFQTCRSLPHGWNNPILSTLSPQEQILSITPFLPPCFSLWRTQRLSDWLNVLLRRISHEADTKLSAVCTTLLFISNLNVCFLT